MTKINGTKITGATSSYIHTGLSNGTTYYYIVTAVNTDGESASSSEISAMPPPQLSVGLVAYYPFNGNANDESGNGNNGTVFGATLTTDCFGNANSAYSFDGNDRIDIPDDPTLTLSNQFTIASWAQFSAFGADGGYYLMGQSEGHGDTTKWIFWLGNNGISFVMSWPEGWIGVGTSGFVTGQWYHVAVRRNGNTLTAFVNGAAIGSATVSISTPDPNAVFQIGTTETDRPNRVFRGLIDEVRIYNRDLTDGEIIALSQQ